MENLDGMLSLLFACIEIVLLVNILIFAEKNIVNMLGAALVFLLFGYQFMEYLICGYGLSGSQYIYIAFVDITFLPPLGLYMVARYMGYKNRLLLLVFIPALFFTIYYGITIDQFVVAKCTVLYAMYHYPLGTLYGVFYYAPLGVVFFLLWRLYKKKINIGLELKEKILAVGFYVTFIPVFIAAAFYHELVFIMESVLCKFALLLAVTITTFALLNKKSEKPEK